MLFRHRHIGPNETEVNAMCKTIGTDSLDTLIDETVPSGIRLTEELNITTALTEEEYLAHAKKLAHSNIIANNFIGQGYYGTITPSVILRNLFENPGWYTQYTPYQAEISQGRLESLLNFQTVISELTGLPIANASLLDEGTAAAEAVTLLHRIRPKEKKDSTTIRIVSSCFSQTVDIINTRAKALGFNVIQSDSFETCDDTFAVIFQYPDKNGKVTDFSQHVTDAKANNIGVAAIADLLSLTLLTPPGEWGVDVVVGSAQRFGVQMGFGGPHAAFMSTKEEYSRQLPGRIIGQSIDKHENRALRMALQTREQHIRKDKATSNICTAQALLANMAAMYAVYHGPIGLTEIANHAHDQASKIAHHLAKQGYTLLNDTFFDTVSISVPRDIKATIKSKAELNNINLFYDENTVSISCDETTSDKQIEELLSIFDSVGNAKETPTGIPESLKRKSSFLTQPVFSNHQTETKMMRYLKQLEDKDLSLKNSMIPLGSCTMKLNAATEMTPVSWPEFSALHPFCPLHQAKGYVAMMIELERDLCEITGLAAMSLQPNSGAQGEYAGLLTIRNYFDAKGESQRNIALIPTSAHGTNPASAVMAGFKVVGIKCDNEGNIDMDDLRAKLEKHKENIGALMVTYPSTHGVFEETIVEMCSLIHEYGGQVYMDGANMNAQVGLTNPGRIGADVCHLNLHKTFAIPHGGGGPGMGPIGVAKHLVEHLPGHSIVPLNTSNSAVSAAPWGSASILLISYAYIKMLGRKGLKRSTKVAILNANYIKAKLSSHYEILFTGTLDRVAHELIVDLRKFKKEAGIEVEDFAKRLIDYGFHAPTMSWPVPGTIMIEPTESEDKDELDRFCDAMISIYNEIEEIKNGTFDKDNNVLKNAPHTMQVCISNSWDYPYDREKAAAPLPYLRERKFWATVGRLNQAHGDRNLICSCGSVDDYE